MSKPVNWDMLPPKIKRDLATELVRTSRGRYIISEALYYAAKYLRSVGKANKDEIEDMEMLRELFGGFQLPEQQKNEMK